MKIELYHSEANRRVRGREVLEKILSVSTSSRKFQNEFLFESIIEVQKEICLWFDDLISCFICKPEDYTISEGTKLPGSTCVTHVDIHTKYNDVLRVFLDNFEEEDDYD